MDTALENTHTQKPHQNPKPHSSLGCYFSAKKTKQKTNKQKNTHQNPKTPQFLGLLRLSKYSTKFTDF